MSHRAPERLEELAAEVRDLEVMPAAEVRARGRRRARRQVAAVTAAGAVVAVTAGAAFVWPREQQPTLPAGDRPSSGLVTCVLSLPDSPADIQVRLPDDRIASELRTRGFTVIEAGLGPAETTTLRYGPASIGAATVLRAAVHGEVTMEFDPGRGDRAIDLIPGPGFTRLATTIEMNQNLIEIGTPVAPPPCS
ncbi:LytR C-terminal domain-containing protein [Actinoplanes sp. NPDC049802]|uniref:LytR C-terminal domain-containing protein n=1 Tax=Actinoplanes sp. NPDC049802 TaxID=3154742 RepID=UPI003404BDDB